MADPAVPEGAALVTGASGFLGRHLLRALRRDGRRVLALCRDPASFPEAGGPSFEVVVGDLERPESYAPHLLETTTVFHLAGARHRPGTPPEAHLRINVSATLELARRAARARIAGMVYVSSAQVFGPSSGGCASETDGWWPEAEGHSYIWSRIEVQQGLRALAAAGLRLVTVYPTIVFGPDEPRHPNVVTEHLRRLLRTRLDVVVAGGRQRRNLAYVDDVVQGLLLAERSGAWGGEFILGGEEVAPRDLSQMALSLAGLRARARLSIPEAAARAAAALADGVRGFARDSGYAEAVDVLAREWRYSSRKAQEELGYTGTPLPDGLRRTLQAIADGRR